jgi:hypothetical protein
MVIYEKAGNSPGFRGKSIVSAASHSAALGQKCDIERVARKERLG